MKYLIFRENVWYGEPTMLDEKGNPAKEGESIWNCKEAYILNDEQVDKKQKSALMRNEDQVKIVDGRTYVIIEKKPNT